jgi:3-dehydroquinate dehydratase/shikimate dehydrogenase
LLFGVIPGPDIAAAERLLSQAKPYIDGIELRLDTFEKVDLAQIGAFIKACGLPVMLTVRSKTQGGSFQGTEEERLKLLESLCALQPAYLDLEYDVPVDFRKKLFEGFPNVIFLSSFHDFSHTPEDLQAVYEKMKTPYAHIYKIAVLAQSTLDSLRMLNFVQSHSAEKLIGICMGEEGRITRILAPVVGCVLTYGSMSVDGANAPGQMEAKELQEIYHFRKLNKQTAIYSLIGDPIDKSLGHLVHNAVFEDAGVNASYVKMRVKKEELKGFFDLIATLPLKGISVTMPLKADVMPFLSEISIQARVIGVCNTIHVKEGKRIGHNTDGIGALNAIEKRLIVFGRHVVLIGAGGAAKSIIFEASQRGAFVTVINRTPEKAVEIAAIFHGRGGGFELLTKVCEDGYDIIVNCTPDSNLIDEKWILPEKIAMDIVYIPKNTPFLEKAAQKKCQIVYGYEMFIGQALAQERIWFPEGIDFEKASRIIEEKVTSNLGSVPKIF